MRHGEKYMAEDPTEWTPFRIQVCQEILLHVEVRPRPDLMHSNALDKMPQSEVVTPCAKVRKAVLNIVARCARLMEVVKLNGEVRAVFFVERNYRRA